MANTLIFVLSGVIITGKIWESSASGTGLIQAADYGYAVLLWPLPAGAPWDVRLCMMHAEQGSQPRIMPAEDGAGGEKSCLVPHTLERAQPGS